jgi:hypothetical protein
MINKIILLNAIFKNDLKKLKGELDQLSKEESNIDELISSLNTLLKDRLYDAKQQNLELLQSNPAKLVNMLSIFLEFQIKIKQASDVQLKKAIFEVACYRIITQLHYSNSNLINLDHNQQKYQATSKNSRSTKIIKNLEPNNHRYIDRYLHIHHRDSYEGVDFTGIIKNGILNIVDQC